jgi:Tfp pilus assembly protein PilF
VNTASRRERIEAMLADEPNDPELRYMLAMEHVAVQDDAAAVACFEEALRRAPNYVPAYHQAARALQRLDRLAEARAMLILGVRVALAQNETHAAEEMQQLLEMVSGD